MLFPIRFANENNGRGPGTVGFDHDSLLKHSLYFFIQELLLVVGYSIMGLFDGRLVGEFDFMLNFVSSSEGILVLSENIGVLSNELSELVALFLRKMGIFYL